MDTVVTQTSTVTLCINGFLTDPLAVDMVLAHVTIAELSIIWTVTVRLRRVLRACLRVIETRFIVTKSLRLDVYLTSRDA